VQIKNYTIGYTSVTALYLLTYLTSLHYQFALCTNFYFRKKGSEQAEYKAEYTQREETINP